MSNKLDRRKTSLIIFIFTMIFFPEVINAFELHHPDIQIELDEFGSCLLYTSDAADD